MRHSLVVLSVLSLLLLAGCDDGPTDTGLSAPTSVTIVQGDGQVGTVGTTLGTTLVVEVTDTTGEAVPGVSVIWSTDDGTVGAASSTTDAFGIAAMSWTLGTEAGAQTASAAVSGVEPVVFNATAEPADPSTVGITNDSLTFMVGDTVQLSAALEDEYGNAITGAEIEWASLNEAVARIDSISGQLIGVGPGTATITATSGQMADTVDVTIYEPESVLPVAWQQTYPLTAGTLSDVWAASASDVFAVGGSGGSFLNEEAGAVVLHFDGTYWTRMDVEDEGTLHAVWGTSASNVFAVGDGGLILHFNGSTWTQMASPTSEHLSGVWGTSATSVFAVGHDGGIFHYDGTQWNVAFSGSLVELHDIWGTSATDMYVVGSGGVIRHWDGAAWHAMATPTELPLYAIWGSASNNIYAVGGEPGNPVVLQYDGTDWVERTTVGATNTLKAVGGTSDSRVMVAGSNQAIRFDGSAWTPMEHRLNPAFEGIGVDSQGALFVVGAGGAIFRNATGAEWQIAHSTAAALDLWAVSETEVFRVGSYGTILRYDGIGWIAMESPTTADLTGVWARDGGSVYAVGGDQILYYDGTTWSPRVTGLTGTFSGVFGLGLNQVYVAGSDGVALFDGNTWTFADPNPSRAVWAHETGVVHSVGGFQARRYDDPDWTDVPNAFGTTFGTTLWGDGPDYLLSCTSGGSTVHYDGEQWQPNEVVVSCTDVHGLSRYDIFVVGFGGQIHHRSGTGLGWTPLMAEGMTQTFYAVYATEGTIFVGGAAGIILHGAR